MSEDEYLVIDDQYSSLVREIEKCYKTIDQLNARIDQQNAKISEFEHKLNILKLDFAHVIALSVTAKDLLRRMSKVEKQLGCPDVVEKE